MTHISLRSRWITFVLSYQLDYFWSVICWGGDEKGGKSVSTWRENSWNRLNKELRRDADGRICICAVWLADDVGEMQVLFLTVFIEAFCLVVCCLVVVCVTVGRLRCCSEQHETLSLFLLWRCCFFPFFQPSISSSHSSVFCSFVDSRLLYVDWQIFWPNRVFRAVCLFVYSCWISWVKTIGFPVEQCQTALREFLMARWVWLRFAIQLLLKKIIINGFVCLFFSFCPNAPHNASWSSSRPQWELRAPRVWAKTQS